MDPETQKQLLEVIAIYGDGWWNATYDDGEEVTPAANAVMVVDELNNFCTQAGLTLTLTKKA